MFENLRLLLFRCIPDGRLQCIFLLYYPLRSTLTEAMRLNALSQRYLQKQQLLLVFWPWPLVAVVVIPVLIVPAVNRHT